MLHYTSSRFGTNGHKRSFKDIFHNRKSLLLQSGMPSGGKNRVNDIDVIGRGTGSALTLLTGRCEDFHIICWRLLGNSPRVCVFSPSQQTCLLFYLDSRGSHQICFNHQKNRAFGLISDFSCVTM